MWNKIIGAFAVAIVAGAMAAGSVAFAEIPKSDSYSMPLGLAASGKLMELGKGHLFWSGEFKGAGQNLHGAFMKYHAWDCSGSNDILDGTASIAGFCRVTDQDGDVAIVKYAGRFAAGGPMSGKGNWIGGTGKYTGIRGGHSFTCNNVGAAEAACTVEGKYELP